MGIPFRHNLSAVLLCAILAPITSAQQNNQPQPSPRVGTGPTSEAHRIAIIYSDFFYDPNNGITRLVNAIKTLNQEFQPRKTELERLLQRIEQLTNETSGSSSGVSQPTIQAKLGELEQLKKDSQRKAEDAETEYSKRMRETLNPIFEDLDKAIKTFAQQRGIVLILDGSKIDDALLYIADGVDLSRLFIEEFNRANPSPAVLSPR